MLAAKPAGEMESCSVLQTDDAFWKIFEFEFLSGKPYDNADFDAGAAKAVISEDMARRLFGTSEVVGKTFLLNHSLILFAEWYVRSLNWRNTPMRKFGFL